MSVLIETSLGDLVIDLHLDHAPRTSLNFLKLCAHHYYNDHLIFSITPTVFRTGCPKNDGTSGASIYALTLPPGSTYIPHEYHPKLTHAKRGCISMTSGGENVGNGSQFFVTLQDGLTHLDRKHTVFGFVAEGLDTLDKIGSAFVDDQGKPLVNIRLRHTIVLHDPFPPVKGLPDAGSSPEPIQDAMEVENVMKEDDKDDEEVTALKREAMSRAEVLEMIGDIDRADLAPPDTVLFVCKLNPVTTSEDLDTVFSRFGNCKADVKTDREGESLCYAFIEFEKKEACEKAYFSMDGVVIDDRRIKVDFSQSVSRAPQSRSTKRREPAPRQDARGSTEAQRKRPYSGYHDEGNQEDRHKAMHSRHREYRNGKHDDGRKDPQDRPYKRTRDDFYKNYDFSPDDREEYNNRDREYRDRSMKEKYLRDERDYTKFERHDEYYRQRTERHRSRSRDSGRRWGRSSYKGSHSQSPGYEKERSRKRARRTRSNNLSDDERWERRHYRRDEAHDEDIYAGRSRRTSRYASSDGDLERQELDKRRRSRYEDDEYRRERIPYAEKRRRYGGERDKRSYRRDSGRDRYVQERR